jgi:serine/threonine protein kinase
MTNGMITAGFVGHVFVDAKKSDVWALGCILYELCTLRHAFDGRTLPALGMHHIMICMIVTFYAPLCNSVKDSSW